jgi:uncharacterized membrane protein
MTDPQPPVPPVPTPDAAVPPVPSPGAVPPPAAPPAQPVYPAYGQPAAAGYYAPPTNTLAIVGMVLSLVGIVVGITAIVGAILGHVALGQIKRTGEGGRGFALTAVIAGWVVTGFWLLFIVAYIVFFVIVLGVASSGAYSSY